MKEELENVLGSRMDIKYEDLANLKYTTCVIKETLRLWPAGKFNLRNHPNYSSKIDRQTCDWANFKILVVSLARVSEGGFKIKDHKIPDGTIILVSFKGFLEILKLL